MSKQKGIFKVKINNGREVDTQKIKQNGESWYTTFETGIAYDSIDEIKSCKTLNDKK